MQYNNIKQLPDAPPSNKAQWIQLCKAIFKYMHDYNSKQIKDDRKLSLNTCYVRIFESILEKYPPLLIAYLQGADLSENCPAIDNTQNLYRAFRYHIQQLTLYCSYQWNQSKGMKLLKFQPNDYQKNRVSLFTWALQASMYYAESHQQLYPLQGNVFQRDILSEFQANGIWFFCTFMHHNALQIQDKIMNTDTKDYKSTYIQIKQNEDKVLYFDTDPQPMDLLTMIDSIGQSLNNIAPSFDQLNTAEKSDFMNYVNWYVVQVTGSVSSDSINKINQLSQENSFAKKYSEFFAASENEKVTSSSSRATNTSVASTGIKKGNTVAPKRRNSV